MPLLSINGCLRRGRCSPVGLSCRDIEPVLFSWSVVEEAHPFLGVCHRWILGCFSLVLQVGRFFPNGFSLYREESIKQSVTGMCNIRWCCFYLFVGGDTTQSELAAQDYFVVTRLVLYMILFFTCGWDMWKYTPSLVWVHGFLIAAMPLSTWVVFLQASCLCSLVVAIMTCLGVF